MTDRMSFFTPFLTLFLFALSSGCLGDEFPIIDPTAFDDDDDNDDDDSITDGVGILDSNHEGWREPNCWDSGCHDSDSHNQGLDPYQCVECHGNNGTRSEHKAGQSCSQCHNNPSDHSDDSFPNNSCTTCHS